MSENGVRGFNQLAVIFTGAILVLILLAGFTWYITQPPPSSSISATITDPVIPTASATPNVTHTPTRRPTWTARPSATPSITPLPQASLTPTPNWLPTLVKARPNQYNDNYVLEAWNAQKASEIARRMREYPEVLYKRPEERTTQAYNDAFIYPSLIYQEALLRFPNDPQVNQWRWGLAYSLARLGDARAVELYTSFLLDALGEGALPLVQLPAWFTKHEPALQLTVHPLPNQPGQLGQALLEVEGGIFIWYLQTPENRYLTPLTTIFDFRPRPDGTPAALYLSSDLTGDTIPELAIYLPPPSGDFTSPEPRVFDLSQPSPRELAVSPAFPVDYKQSFLPALHESDQRGRFNVEMNFFAACPVRLVRSYAWNGSAFIPGEREFTFTVPSEGLEHCETILTHAETYWEPHLAAEISNALLPAWPPALDLQGRLYPGDAAYELIYRHAVSSALAGDRTGAVAGFQRILDNPVIPESTWKTAARAFLATYQSQSDLYRACLPAPGCSTNIAMRKLVQSSGISDVAVAQEYLRTSGVTIRSAGIFDFDLDGTNERWITMQPRPGDRLEFWILAKSAAGVQALFLDYIEINTPTVYFSLSSPGLPVFQLNPRQGYRLLYHAESGLPYLIDQPVEPALTTYTRDALFAAEISLFSGTSPNEVRHNLEEVLNSGRFNCRTHAICDRYYYLLGLVYELNGQPRASIDTYLKLWWENATSPLTTAARHKLKLVQIIKPTATRTPTGQAYPTVNPYVEPVATTYPYPYPTIDYSTPTPDYSAYPTP